MTMRSGTRHILSTSAALAAALAASPSFAVTDGFGDGDRNNNGAITPYDTDVNLDGVLDTYNPDKLGITLIPEVTTPQDAGDIGIIWASTRGFTGANDGDPKSNIKIIDDSAGLGSGLALGVESKGTGSSFAGFFGSSIELGPNLGDKVVVSLSFRVWTDSNNPTPPPANGELRWGLFQDTDNEFGMTANEGLNDGVSQAPVVWGPDTGENDGDWFDAPVGAEGDKGIWSRVQIGALADATAGRINFEFNQAGINGTSNNGRFFEGNGTSNTPGSGGDVATVASPTSDGPGLKIGGDLVTDPTNQIPVAPHTLMMEIVRGADGLIVRSFVDGALGLEDDITSSLTGAAFMLPAPESFDYIAFRNSVGDYDYIIDNVSVESVLIPEPAGLALLGLAGLMTAGRRR